MPQRLVIIGTGFAGLDAALSAARLRDLQGVSPADLEIAIVSPQPVLNIRPRLYEPNPETLFAPLGDLFAATDIRHVAGLVDTIDTDARTVTVVGAGGSVETLAYDRLVLASGSQLFRPNIPGLAEHAYSVDQIEDAVSLDLHLKTLARRPESVARNTVIVGGGGFTGLEAATEMPTRLREVLGADADIHVVIVERGAVIGPDIGADPRPHIEAALKELGVTMRLGSGIAAVDAEGVTLADGQRIDAATVVWSAGMRANPLTAQIAAPRDDLGRLVVDRFMRVPDVAGVFATGDAAKAATDDDGNFAVMSCQHAKRMGAFAGNNAAAELLGVEPDPYHQKPYVTCLDLGPWGAVYSEGWDRQVRKLGDEAKALKREINTVWIYPPPADREKAFAYAVPANVVDLS